MNVVEFEQKIFEIEGVRIVIRMTSGSSVGDYDYKKAYPQNNSIREWLDTRVFPKIGDSQVVVVDGTGALPNRKTHMTNLRNSYAEE
jgi:hypothetical protein